MNKTEYISQIIQLKRKSSYLSDTNSWDKDKAYEECKEAVIKLAADLDVEGLTIKAFELFREQVNETTKLFTDLFVMQKEIHEKNKQIADMEKRLYEYESKERQERHINEPVPPKTVKP